MTHQLNTKMPRSQSATRARHSVDHSTTEMRRKSVAPPQERSSSKPPHSSTLQVQDQSPIISHRRGSSVRFQNSPKPGSSPSCRSRSLKSPIQRRNSKIPSSSSGSNLHQENNDPRALNYSLSVPGDENEFHRLRNFSLTSKGIINRGDSFRCKSSSTSRSSSPKTPPAGDHGHLRVIDDAIIQCRQEPGACSSDAASDLPATSSGTSTTELSPRYKVWIMGLSGVGKTSLKLQFMTSEYICQYDNWRDENAEKNVTIVLDGEEHELEITELSGFNDKAIIGSPVADAFIVVYSVANRRSYVHAKQILSRLEPLCGSKAVIVVGNKTDLARLRTVNTIEGRSLAKEWGCKFIETSVAINHQVDELLVGIITQIRIRAKLNEKNKKKQGDSSIGAPTRRSKATGIIKRLWRKTCMTNKSCDNLHCV